MKTLSVKKCLFIILLYFTVTFGFNLFLPKGLISQNNVIYLELLVDSLITLAFFFITKDELRGELNIYKAELPINLKNTIKSTFIIYFVCDLIASIFLFVYLMINGDNVANGINSNLQTAYLLNKPIVFIFLAVIIGPFIEEILFRGAIFNLIAKKNEELAVVITALIFALIHFSGDIFSGSLSSSLIPQVITYMILSYALTNHYYHNRNIFDMIGIHAIYNLISVVISLVLL